MADFEEEDEAFLNDDYYAVLNVRKEVGILMFSVKGSVIHRAFGQILWTFDNESPSLNY